MEDDQVRTEIHPLVELARSAVEVYVRYKRVITPPEYLSPEMDGRAGVFVSLKKAGDLRGCIGTFEPTTDSIADEVIRNAVSSATQDPRFLPVSEDELDGLSYSVDVLTTPEPIETMEQLNPVVYGVLVVSGGRRGLLLPDLEGVDTSEQQVNIACRKAGISPRSNVELYRFRVKRFH